jgi:uncharacterized protein involved in exopolysaccharide biosynthesis
MTERRTVFSLLDDIAAHPVVVLGLPFTAALVTAGIVLIVPSTYASSASFVPEARSQTRLPAGLSGIASQFGFNIGGEASRSPAFYADLLRSREILSATLPARVPDPEGTRDSITVADLYKVEGRTAELRLEEGVRTLRNRITVAVDPRVDVVHLEVSARYPTAARDVARILLRQLGEFNLDTRQNTARNRRQFIEARVAAAAHDLETAEDALRRFYERNRQLQTSPQLRFEEQRLTRQLSVQQEVYLTLRREYETARIEEVNNTPVLTMIDEPEVPGRRIRPKRTLTVLVVALIVGLLACVLAIATERHRELLASGDPQYRRLLQRLRIVGQSRQRSSPASEGVHQR